MQPTNAGSYTVVVTNTAGSVTSAVAVLTVLVPPAITAQPTNLVVVAGANASFNVTASGTLPLSYQWQFNGAGVTGATGTSLALTGVQPTNAGSYTVVVTNTAGSVTSAVAVLTVLVPPAITSQPTNLVVMAGASASFSVTASGTLPLSYQWQFNGAGVAGATGTSLALTGVQPTNAGSYAVVVTNTAGSVTSAVAVLTVLVPPAITVQPTSLSAAYGSNATFNVAASGTLPLNYQWRFNGANITGATSTSLTLTSVQPTDAGSYTVVVTNTAGAATSAVAVLTVLLPPAIIAQPTSLSVTYGAAASFNVTASGTLPLGYQWRFNNTGVTGATGTSLTLTSVQLTNAGSYTVVVTNTAGVVTSAVAVLTVLVPSASCSSAPSGLAGWWPGDGNANDIAGTNNGTLQGGATANGVGMVGSAFTFDGTNGYVQIPDAPALKPTNLTVEAWVQFASLNSSVSGAAAGEQYIVFKQNSRSGNFEGYYLGKTRIAGQDHFTFQISSASGATVELDSVTLVATGAWYHVAAVRGSNYVQLYVNGALESTNSISFAQDYGTLPLYFGTSGQTYWDGKLKGTLDEVKPLQPSLVLQRGRRDLCGRRWRKMQSGQLSPLSPRARRWWPERTRSSR